MNPVAALFLVVALADAPIPASGDAAELGRLLDWFLAGAGGPGAEVHERFWADDLIYTGSSGRRVGKGDILRDVRAAPPPAADDPVTTYGAEDVRIQLYGNAALVAFRLVATTELGDRREVARYLNTGTFLKRDGSWRAVGWQATRMPFPEDEARAGVAAAAAGFRRALAAGDTTALASWTAPGFHWIAPDGRRLSRRDLLAGPGRGAGTPSGESAGDASISIQGETAIVRDGGGDGPVRQTMTLVRDGGGWRVLAVHSSRP